MASRERPVDRGTRLGRRALDDLGREIRAARRDRGLSINEVAGAVGISNAEVSRIERGLAPRAPVIVFARGAVGLDFVVRCYPGPAPIRDAGHEGLLQDLRFLLHPSLRWAREVPLPIPGDQRSWDGMVIGDRWRFAVEAETSPTDAKVLARRLSLKFRDGDVDGLLLVVRDGRGAREFAASAAMTLQALFPISARQALAALRAGRSPGGSAIVLLRRPARLGHPPGV